MMKKNTLKKGVNLFGGTSKEAASTNLGRMLEQMIKAFSILNTLISDAIHGLINIAKSLANSMMHLMSGIGLGLLALSTAILGAAIVTVGGASALSGVGLAIYGVGAAIGGHGTGQLVCLAGILLGIVGMGLFLSKEIFFGSSDRYEPPKDGIVQKLFGDSGENFGKSWDALKGMFQTSSEQTPPEVITVEGVPFDSESLSSNAPDVMIVEGVPAVGPEPKNSVTVEGEWGDARPQP